MTKCKKCNYQLFPYSQCCPMCGSKVVKSHNTRTSTPPVTRLDFWLAGLKKTAKPTRTRRPISS